jgi:hypothetical protein
MQRTQAIGAIFLIGIFTAYVHADDIPPPPPRPAATARPVAIGCKRDIQTFCSEVAPGGGRVVACLKTHRDQLSNDCRAAFRTARLERQQAAGEVPPGGPPPSGPPPSGPPPSSPPPSGSTPPGSPPAGSSPKSPPPTSPAPSN